jgi:hypothetical protein
LPPDFCWDSRSTPSALARYGKAGPVPLYLEDRDREVPDTEELVRILDRIPAREYPARTVNGAVEVIDPSANHVRLVAADR